MTVVAHRFTPPRLDAGASARSTPGPSATLEPGHLRPVHRAREEDSMADARDTVAPVDWEVYQRDAKASLEKASTSEEVESVSVAFLGRKSELKQALREVRDRETGMTLNAVREAIEAALAAKLARVEAEELERRLAEERVDVTLPAELL